MKRKVLSGIAVLVVFGFVCLWSTPGRNAACKITFSQILVEDSLIKMDWDVLIGQGREVFFIDRAVPPSEGEYVESSGTPVSDITLSLEEFIWGINASSHRHGSGLDFPIDEFDQLDIKIKPDETYYLKSGEELPVYSYRSVGGASFQYLISVK